MADAFDFDVIVIGSGFGGSVTTCRLAEKGYHVALLERGRQYGMHEFPRRMDEMKSRLFWDPDDGYYGFMEFRTYPASDAFSVCASGLGGGSLIYANVLMEMPAAFFAGWPGGITRETLNPFYARGLEMLEAAPYPYETNPYYRDTPKTEAFRAASDAVKDDPDAIEPHRFLFPNLAIRFKGDFPGHQTLNQQGVVQSSCIKCGECDVGCNVHAKNTLDLNYIARARNQALLGPDGKAAEVRTGALVKEISPLESGGYAVTYVNPLNQSEKTTIRAQNVVVSAGCVGTNALLLKMRKYKKLNHLSPMLGKKWCGNGDLEGTVLFSDREHPLNNGPVITAAVQHRFKDYPDGFGHGLVLQEAGIPNFIAWFIAGRLPSFGFFYKLFVVPFSALWNLIRRVFTKRARSQINPGNYIASLMDQDSYLRKTMVLLGMGRDRSDGEVTLNDDDEPIIRWRMDHSRLHYDRVRREMEKMAHALGGKFMENPISYMDKIIAVHPLGGCVMADTAEGGVVDTRGEVFGHPGLFVVDASVLPTSVGPNPSLTITALAEYFASKWPKKGA